MAPIGEGRAPWPDHWTNFGARAKIGLTSQTSFHWSKTIATTLDNISAGYVDDDKRAAAAKIPSLIISADSHVDEPIDLEPARQKRVLSENVIELYKLDFDAWKEKLMPLDGIDKGRIAGETDEMRLIREENTENAPPAEFFKLRAELLQQGRTNQRVADTGNMWVNLKVYASGGENGLHNHTDQDHFHLVLSGKACFHGPRGEEKICSQYEGIMLPSGSYYRFEAVGDEPLILLRVAAKTDSTADHPRYNIYGEPLPSHLKENGGQIEIIPRQGEYWGAAE